MVRQMRAAIVSGSSQGVGAAVGGRLAADGQVLRADGGVI